MEMMYKETQQETDRRKALETLAELGGKLQAEDDVIFRGKQFVLPERLTLEESIEFLYEKRKEDEEEISFSRTYNYRPWDGARATMSALKSAFGFVRQKATYSMFGKNPPQMITIPVDVNEEDQIPWGAMTVPIVPNTTLHLGASHDEELGLVFNLRAEGPRKHRFEIEGIFRLVEEELKKNSLYRGKAFDGQEKPQFLDLSGITDDKVVYSEEVLQQLDANVWSPLKHSEQHRKLGVPLKRAVLLEGPYGTGKTLAAFLTAKVAIANGWTFIYCRPGRDSLSDVMATARLYQPAVVFFEDVDTIADDNGSRDSVSKLLDIFDGIQAKGTEILAVLTTNHAEKIHRGMVRPGRLDAVIHVGALDQAGVEKLAKSLIPDDLLDPDINWEAVFSQMEGYMPAFCKEAIDRTLRYSMARNNGEPSKLTTADFVAAAAGLRPQLDLMEGAHEGKPSDAMEVQIGKIVKSTVSGMRVERTDGGGDFATLQPMEDTL